MMEASSEETRPVHAIAADVGLSPRQLERLFARYLQARPARYYLQARLARARTMLAGFAGSLTSYFVRPSDADVAKIKED